MLLEILNSSQKVFKCFKVFSKVKVTGWTVVVEVEVEEEEEGLNQKWARITSWQRLPRLATCARTPPFAMLVLLHCP